MLPPAARLRRRVDFAATTRGGRRASRGSLVVHLAAPADARPAGPDEVRTEQAGADYAGHDRVGAVPSGVDLDRSVRPGSGSVGAGDRAPGSSAGSGPTPSATPRAGFAVSKAVGNAVVRNRVRRRLRHLMAERLDRLPAGSTLVVRALPVARERTFQELGSDLDAAIAAARSPRRPRRDRDSPGDGRRVRPDRAVSGRKR